VIYRIYSNLPKFKELRLHQGLNVILADKSPGATEKQTRNGAGKSSLIELIHFLMGASLDPSSLWRTNALSQHSFGMEFDLGQARTQIERSGDTPNKVMIRQANPENWPIKPSRDRSSGALFISNTNWRVVLGRLMFGLTEDDDGIQASKFGPTFRSLFSYFARRQSAGGFVSPIKQSIQQQTWDQHVAISYLLGLDWTIPQQWQYVHEKEKTLKELKKAATGGVFGDLIGASAELRTKLTLSEERSHQLKEQISRFQVLPEYRNLEKEASQLTRDLGTLADENTIDQQLLDELQQSLNYEVDSSVNDLERLYEEAGVILPKAIIHRFEDVKLFHESIIENRRSYLGNELEQAKRRIKTREEQMARINERLAQVMAILQSHGALDQFAKLQSELAKQEAETESIRKQFAAAEQLEGLKSELGVERRQLELRLRQDYHEQKDVLRHAILAFEEISGALYEKAGSLIIDASLNGPRFDLTIHGQKSKGISNMQIFCFDMMLMRLWAERNMGPGFLVHDSHIFDGVDERQIAKALQIGERTARDLNFQYIVTMNSDAVPHDFPDNFNLREYTLPIRLTDATEDGGLFGVRF
jgi:uncharacterized protein YydD (DUF2326 family)